MSIESNKAAARHLVEDGLNKGNMAVVDEVYAANFVERTPTPGLPPNREGFKMFMTGFRAAFPDLHYHIESEVAEGDLVTQFLTGHGTMKSEFQGMPATNKTGEWTEMHLGRFENGKLMEHWAVVDQMGMLISLGVMPPPGAPQ